MNDKEYSKEYYIKHKERIREYKKRWWLKHKSRVSDTDSHRLQRVDDGINKLRRATLQFIKDDPKHCAELIANSQWHWFILSVLEEYIDSFAN